MSVRVAVAQLAGNDQVPSAENLSTAGEAIRTSMRDAVAGGADLILFHEGALAYPHKRLMSVDPERVAAADWTRADWRALRFEYESTAALARELGLWTVLHGPHRLTGENRPHNSLYVISDSGEVVARYDKRLLSQTEVAYLYTPGTEPVVFAAGGVRFGLALCIEAAFPELFLEYANLGVDCVLFSSSPGMDETYCDYMRSYARLNGMWIAAAFGGGADAVARSGVVAPDGTWLARSEAEVTGVVAAPIAVDDGAYAGARHFGRAWRSSARSGDAYRDALRDGDPLRRVAGFTPAADPH